ncbi:unnamed protein product, partial [Cyprideis torosa]
MLMIPAMISRGYDRGYASAATAASGGVGIIIPPSIPMVIFGVTAQESITEMFIAGVIPGLLIAVGLIIVHLIRCRGKGYGIFIYKELSLKGVMSSLETTSWLTGRVLVIMFTAYSFGRLLVQYRIPDIIAEALLSLTSDVHLIWAL